MLRPRSSLLVLLALLSCRAPESSIPPSSETPEADAGTVPDAGASDDAGSEMDGGPLLDAGVTVASASNYCEQVAPFFCDFYVRCKRIAADTPEACRQLFLQSCNARFEPRYEMLEDAGMLALSSSGIEECRARLSSVSCDEQPFDLVGECAQMWQGRQQAGGPCGLDVESLVCPAGTSCRLDLSFCGTCEPTVALGQECGDGGSCAPEAQCIQGRCLARGLPGQPCDAQRKCLAGVSCVSGLCRGPTWAGVGETCGSGRRCVYNSACIAGTCKRTANLGEPCDAQTACAAGNCVQRAGGATCEPLKAVGTPCGASTECESAYCVAGACSRVPSACFDVR